MEDIFDSLDPKKFIIIKNARENNLKNLSVAIPRNKLVVVTGVSGSGKSSLAFDTLFAEGQRMYVESLNSYARQFLGRMQKPDVDYIKGVAPAIAIEQKVNTRNPRSTVGTTTEIYDYLKLLYARVGTTFSPVSGNIVKKNTVSDVVSYVNSFPKGSKYVLSTPLIIREGKSLKEELNVLIQKGFTRILQNESLIEIEEILEDIIFNSNKEPLKILIDRAAVNAQDEEAEFRLSDSVQTAFYEGEGMCEVLILNIEKRTFSDRFEADNMVFEEPTVNMFAFNNPFGACKTCEGFGHVLGIDPGKVFPSKSLSVYEGAIAPWKGEKMGDWLTPLIKNAIKFNFPIHRPIHDLNEEQYQLLWNGNKYFEGLHAFFKYLETESYKIQYRVMLSRYRGRTVCPDCKGTRLRKDAQYVKIESKNSTKIESENSNQITNKLLENNSFLSITDVVLLPIAKAYQYFNTLQLSEYQQEVANRLLTEIKTRLYYLCEVGLGYLTLNRLTNTLSGGEFQRIKLATSLGSALVGSMYILDEPSIGLHPRDTERLVSVLKKLRDLGNTVIVVEHEEEVMRAADQIIDIGPDAGMNGGNLIRQFNIKDMNSYDNSVLSHTFNYLSGIEKVALPLAHRKSKHFIKISGAKENNLKNIDVKFPLGVLTVVTGVSGSGKSTLIKKILHPALSKIIDGTGEDFTGNYERFEGDIKEIRQVEFVDQNPIGKSSRSNPVTYTKAYDYIRTIFSETPLAKQRAYKPSHFSFNVEGGRCETCQGEGFLTIEMQFMADVRIKCESCHGKRFKQEILEVKYNDKDISDILAMTVDESVIFFKDKPRILEKMLPLQEVGLGYIGLGQSSSTLSGGEAQRVKLATFIAEGRNSKEGGLLFIFDEPTTGLHFHDISKLLIAIQTLVDQGNSVIIIEHNMEIIKCADWIIDIGPEGGDEGGNVCFEGTPEEMVKIKNNHTAQFLKEKLK
ncbi:MAG: excinuclease ABC subunit A [Cytophagales bacterium]|nr:MAG: excinuclease ABC subunit A [Cytophagales bacterium]